MRTWAKPDTCQAFLVTSPGKILEMEDMAVLGGQLGMYTLTVIVGLFVHAGGILPLIYFLITHRNPFPFIGGILQALITAMGTSSRYGLDPYCWYLS